MIPPPITLVRSISARVSRYWRSITNLPPSSDIDITVQFYGPCSPCPELDLVRTKFRGRIS